MVLFPQTSPEHYITGKAALNVPNEDGTFADWHFDEVFLSGRGKIRIAGQDAPETTNWFGDYGIRECGDVLRRFGVAIDPTAQVYSATHVRAILDMLISSLCQHRLPLHVSVEDLLDSTKDVAQLKGQLQNLKTKLTDKTSLLLLEQWERNKF
jgi:hypothetical protein